MCGWVDGRTGGLQLQIALRKEGDGSFRREKMRKKETKSLNCWRRRRKCVLREL
jgi:hypothetical protein